MQDKEQRLREFIKIRVPHYHPDFPFILFWSQKSGCTTLLKWFFYQVNLLDEALTYNHWIHAYDQEIYKREPAYYEKITNSLLKEEKITVKLVRNPYRRAVSQFLILASSKGNAHWAQEWGKIREFFYDDKNSRQGISFKQFLTYLQEADGYDSHFSPQYTTGEEEFVRNYIYLEKFRNQLKRLERKYQLKDSNITKLSTSPHHLSSMMSTKGSFANYKITEDTFTEKNQFPTVESFYDREAIQLVNEIFSDDFNVYGYKKFR